VDVRDVVVKNSRGRLCQGRPLQLKLGHQIPFDAVDEQSGDDGRQGTMGVESCHPMRGGDGPKRCPLEGGTSIARQLVKV